LYAVACARDGYYQGLLELAFGRRIAAIAPFVVALRTFLEFRPERACMQ
jgi:hypothetical protein